MQQAPLPFLQTCLPPAAYRLPARRTTCAGAAEAQLYPLLLHVRQDVTTLHIGGHAWRALLQGPKHAACCRRVGLPRALTGRLNGAVATHHKVGVHQNCPAGTKTAQWAEEQPHHWPSHIRQNVAALHQKKSPGAEEQLHHMPSHVRHNVAAALHQLGSMPASLVC